MNRDFRLFWTGQATSAFGSVLTTVALPLVAVRQLGASPAQMGLLIAAGTVPLLMFGLLIAAWVDRLPRRRPYLIAGDLLSAATLGWLIVGLATGRLPLWALAIAVFVLGLIGVMVESAYFAHLRSLVGDDDIVGSRARLQAGEQTGGVLARALAGPAVVIGAVLPFAIDALSFLVSAATLLLIRKPETRRPAAGGRLLDVSELGAGLTILRRDAFLRRMTPFVVGQQIVAGVTLALAAPFLLDVLDVPTAMYGLVYVFLGVAAIAGSAAATRWASRVESRRLAALAYLGTGAATLILPFAGGPLPLAIVLAAAGIGLPYFFGAIANVGLTAFVTAAVAEDKLGRVAVGLQLVAGAALVAGSLAGGFIAQYIGVRATLLLAAALSVGTLAILRPLLPRSGRDDREDVVAAPAEISRAQAGRAHRPGRRETARSV
jgi:MFS family permease